MIAVDTNILAYALRADSPWHQQANQAVDFLRCGDAIWAIPWPCLHELFSVCTHPKIYQPPTKSEVMLEMFEDWVQHPSMRFLHEGPGYIEKLARLVRQSKICGPRIHDARIAAICLNHGVSELWTADRDFSAFAPLKTRNPLVDMP